MVKNLNYNESISKKLNFNNLYEGDLDIYIYMNIKKIKFPKDIFQYMNNHIEYGWIYINGEKHIKTMQDFRK
ncbi:hypothetical protein FDB55_09355 [Clostridium botulinum]|nr:hypothetical protein ACP51_04785 [Clostridium botulinum]KOR57392.1 hypothetical protein ADT22_11475 [Clostridium botulinum]MCS6109902.1 hypothetical protein [Clostridium botulinum]NFG10631.1 hypothetical protein [Clostridium botulinum]NFL37726.1 hypothetical protein [Clostridium botulinum]